MILLFVFHALENWTSEASVSAYNMHNSGSCHRVIVISKIMWERSSVNEEYFSEIICLQAFKRGERADKFDKWHLKSLKEYFDTVGNMLIHLLAS